MAITQRLKDFLDSKHVHYDVLAHQVAYTAPELAHALHVPGKEFAKVVVTKVGKQFVITVLPSTWNVDLTRLTRVFGTMEVRLATEEELRGLFPDCELGAMSPFGNLYGLGTYVDRSLTEDEKIVFRGGSRSDAVRMRYQDFATLAQATVAEFHS